MGLRLCKQQKLLLFSVLTNDLYILKSKHWKYIWYTKLEYAYDFTEVKMAKVEYFFFIAYLK